MKIGYNLSLIEIWLLNLMVISFYFIECCAVFTALPSFSQTLPTELKESRPSATYWTGSGLILRLAKYIRVARLLTPGAHLFIEYCRCADYSFRHVPSRSFRRVLQCLSVAYRLAPFLAYCSVLLSRIVSLRLSRIALSSCIVSFVLSRDLVFASEFLTVARIVPSSFRVWFYLCLAYGQAPISKLPKFSRIVPILWFIIVDGLSRDSAIPGAIP